MRCNPWRWLWGLFPVIALAWVGVHVEHGKIEQDLERRTKQGLAAAGLGWADISFSGRDGLLTGKAAEEGEAAKALDATLATYGVRLVSDSSGLIDKVDRYEWTAMRRDNRIRINGLVPNETTRREVIGIVKASFPTLEVEDRMRLARGAPTVDTWLGGVGFGIKQLAQLRNGQIDLNVTALTISGEALDAQAYTSVKEALAGRLPPGITLKADRVTPPVVKPHVWSARRSQEALLLRGYVPSEKDREDILSLARTAGGGKVVDEMQFGDGVAEGWQAVAATALRVLGGAEEGAAEIRDSVLAVSILVETEDKAEAARKDLRQGVLAAFKVSEQIRVKAPPLPTISPYRTSAALEPESLSLSGHVPDEAARKTVIAFARQQLGPAIQVRDALQLGLGQPQGWQKCLETGLAALARLGNGSASLVDRHLHIVAQSDAADLARVLPERVRTAVGSNCEADVRVTVASIPEPQFRWSAALLQPGELVLSGSVAGDDTRAQLLQAAAELFPRAQISDRMTVVAGGSQNWTKAAGQGLALLGTLQTGTVQLANQELTVSGEAREPAVREAIRAALARDLPSGYSGAETVSVRAEPPVTEKSQEPTSAILPKRNAEDEARRKAEADACQSRLQSVMQRGVIRFNRSSAELDRASYPTLMRLADVATKCPNVHLEIAGYTDADGNPEHNQRLSEQRALSVAEFLSRAGVDRQQMRTVGYGETHPVSANDTARNKARNRRIEFNVRTD